MFTQGFLLFKKSFDDNVHRRRFVCISFHQLRINLYFLNKLRNAILTQKRIVYVFDTHSFKRSDQKSSNLYFIQ